MVPVDREVLRQKIRDDLKTLTDLEGYAVRWNQASRTERVFWPQTVLDVAEVALPYSLVGRIALRFIRRIAERAKRTGGK